MMKFFSDIRLLILAVWLGAAVFFIGVAASAFAVLFDQRELAGAVVNRNLSVLNIAGIGIAILLILTSFVGASKVNQVWLWVERFLLLAVGAACTVGQFVIAFWMATLRNRIAGPIDEVAADDPLRIQFNTLHDWSQWVLFAAMIAALLAFFIISNRKFSVVKTEDNVYDFKKEFPKV